MLSTAYDAVADALYIRLRQGKIARTETLDEWTLVDVDNTGAALGIEVIHPARVWPLRDLLDRFKIEGPNRKLLEDMFPAAGKSRRAAYSAQDLDVDSAAERVCIGL